MAFSVLQGLPSVLTVGDAVSFSIDDTDHPASSWTSTVYFRDSAGAVLSFARTSTSGNLHIFALTNANMLTLSAGENLASFVFSDGTHRATSDQQSVSILPDPTVAATPSFAQAQVTLLQTVVAAFSTSAHQTVSFNGQSFTKSNVTDYRNQLVYWQAIVIQENAKANALRGIPQNAQMPIAFVRS